MSPALPPFTPDLLAFDLDGTLLDDLGTDLPEGTEAALSRLHALGVRLAIITGRDTPPRPVREALDFDATVTNNGGRIEVGGELLSEVSFGPEDLDAVLAHGLGDARVVAFTAQDIFVELPAGREPEAWMLARQFRPLAERPREGVTKVGFYHPQVAGYAARLRQSHPHVVVTGGQAPYEQFLTVTPSGAHKAAGLLRAAEALGFGLEHVVAFGDSDNDEVMLEAAGFAVQVGTLPLLTRHADAQVSGPRALHEYLTALADRIEAQQGQ